MTIKKIQLQNASEDVLHPETDASLVKTVGGGNLGEVEPGAQVNVIDTIKVNGVAQTITSKAVDITIASQSEYSIAEAATAEAGYLKTYKLTKDGNQVGASINIPKDFLVKSSSVGICETAGVPATTPALAVGDPYMDFVINTKDGSGSDEHLYINCKAFVDTYTPGTGLTLTGHEFSVDNSVVAFKSDLPVAISDLTDDTATTPVAKASTLDGLTATVAELNFVDGVTSAIQGQIDGKVSKLSTKPTAGSYTKVTINAEGQVTAGADLAAADIPSLSLSKISDVSATAQEVNYLSGVTSNVQTQLNGKQATINASNKLSADFIAEGTTNAVISKTEKAAFAAKQDAITSENKLGAGLIETTTDLQFVSATEKSTWNNKQNAISDLATIRANAEAGAGAATAIAGFGDIVSHDADEFAAAVHTHTAAQVTGLATVATSGAYSDLTGTPDVYTKSEVDALLLNYIELE